MINIKELTFRYRGRGPNLSSSFGMCVTLGGLLNDRLIRRDLRWNLWMPSLISLAAFPFALPFYLSGDRTLALASFGVFYFLNNMYVGPMWSLTQGLVGPRMRALAAATLLAALNLVGQGIGPQVIGFANDLLADRFGDEAIRFSLSAMAGAGLFAALFFALAARKVREDLAAVARSGG